MPPTEKTAAGLRELLFQQIDGVRDGTIDIGKAKAVAVLAQTVLKSVEVEMEFRRQQAELKNGEDLGAMQLTGPMESPVIVGAPRLVRGRAHSGSE